MFYVFSEAKGMDINMKILIVSHGDFAKGLCNTLSMFFGENDVDYISLSSEGVEHYVEELKDYLEGTSDDIIILCDLQGGTPFNQAVHISTKMQIQDRIEIVAGVNLPMILQLYSIKDTLDIKSAKSICEEFGKLGIVSFSNINYLQEDAF